MERILVYLLPFFLIVWNGPLVPEPVPANSLPDARVQRISAACDEGMLQLGFQLCNAGEGILPAATPWVLYHRDPRLFAAEVLAQGTIGRDLLPDSCYRRQLVFPGEVGESFFLLLNARPEAIPPFDLDQDFPATSIREASYADNLGSLVYSCNRRIFVPTGFSPNDDGINDLFYLRTGFGVERIEELRVFNRWGEAVFQAQHCLPNDPACGWNGDYRGKPADPAVYIWKASLVYMDGTTEVMRGEVVLIR